MSYFDENIYVLLFCNDEIFFKFKFYFHFFSTLVIAIYYPIYSQEFLKCSKYFLVVLSFGKTKT